MDVVGQIVHQFACQRVQPRPTAAGVFGNGQIVGQFQQSGYGLVVFLMLVHHHTNRHRRPAPDALFDHGKQHALFLHHVHQQFVLHINQQFWHFRRKTVGMYLRNFLRQRNQFFKLRTVYVVVALQDMVDGCTKRRGFPYGKISHGSVLGFISGRYFSDGLWKDIFLMNVYGG